MSLGPISGWLLAALDRRLADAFPLLLLPTSVCAAAFAAAVVEPSAVSRFVFALTWLATGYPYTIAIWV